MKLSKNFGRPPSYRLRVESFALASIGRSDGRFERGIRFCRLWCLGLLIVFNTNHQVWSQDQTVAELRTQAVVDAIQSAESSVVRIELFENQGRDESLPRRRGTGVVLSADGLIVTDMYFVGSEKAQPIVYVQNKKYVAKVVGLDHSRSLAFLKVATATALPTLTVGGKPAVGETVIALGRTLSEESVNASTGIVSALGRIRGKAIQTDAKISPANYGGPLLNLEGQFVGLLTAMSPDESRLESGAEWYDSGIGFAIVAKQVKASFRKLDGITNLYPGRLGVRFSDRSPGTDPPRVNSVFPGSPADVAGLRRGDTIVSVGESRVQNKLDFQRTLAGYYGGEKILLGWKRTKPNATEDVSAQIVLATKLKPYEFPYAGLLVRNGQDGTSLTIRDVDREGPSFGKLQRGDRIVVVDGQAIEDPTDLRQKFATFQAGQPVPITIDRQGKPIDLKIVLGDFAKSSLGLKFSSTADLSLDPPTFKPVWEELSVQGVTNRCLVLRPSTRRRSALFNRKGLVCVPANKPRINQVQWSDRWHSIAENLNLVILVPLPVDESGWSSEQSSFLFEAVREAERKFEFQRTRSVFWGIGRAVQPGVQLVRNHRWRFSGLVCEDPEFSGGETIPSPLPGRPLSVLGVESTRKIAAASEWIRRFDNQGLPADIWRIASRDRWTAEEKKRLATWLSQLDRF